VKQKKEVVMLIKVMYKDGKYGMVKPFLLDRLIVSGKIIKFLRSEGWIVIGVDRIRGAGDGGCYQGPERRKDYSFIKFMRWYIEEFSNKVILGA
jgi:hypothetical protein